ncbi:hypothetical protein [uncultured Psychroserpens sp.]|uniref:hypothetical protein n=1 Tax=uncultured Psychroserpens sp. TaxID=255436 RepID=UPI0026095134|nr:hypothetical protein [uncultured Psychroserpens sp.]
MIVNVETTDTYEAGDGSGVVVPIDRFGGNKDTGKKTEDGKSIIKATQHIDTKSSKRADFFGEPGDTMIHTVTEGYEGSKISQEKGYKNIGTSDSNSRSKAVYDAAHDAAVPVTYKLSISPPKNGRSRIYVNGVYINKTIPNPKKK